MGTDSPIGIFYKVQYTPVMQVELLDKRTRTANGWGHGFRVVGTDYYMVKRGRDWAAVVRTQDGRYLDLVDPTGRVGYTGGLRHVRTVLEQYLRDVEIG